LELIHPAPGAADFNEKWAAVAVTRPAASTGQEATEVALDEGFIVLPGGGRLAFDTTEPLDQPEAGGVALLFRLRDEAGRSHPGGVLSYSVAWFFACSMDAPCALGRMVSLSCAGGAQLKVLSEVSRTEVRIVADGWPPDTADEAKAPAAGGLNASR
jgi:hypothetical protein